MQVSRDAVVTLTFEVRDSQGVLVESTPEPIAYLHGRASLFPRLEAALEGKAAGEQCEVALEPEDAFGDYDAELVFMEPRDKFPADVKVGMQFEGKTDGGDETRMFRVTDIAEGKVVVDANHPLAGMALRFLCAISEVRAATAEELAHGHVHGPGGHHHH
ncbi:MAG: FKBP-type peptidyl-prolyl cis-trans isomerase [Burkholderiales bacterium]